MSIYDWVLSAAVVLLWLYALSVKHSVEVLRDGLDQHKGDKFVHGSDFHMDFKAWCLLWENINAKLDKPLLRRATDKKAEEHWAYHLTAAGEYPDTPIVARKKKAAKR